MAELKYEITEEIDNSTCKQYNCQNGNDKTCLT